MKAFFFELLRKLGNLSIFKNFAKPIPRNDYQNSEEINQPIVSISYQTLETRVEPLQIETIPTFEASESRENERVAVAVLPEVILMPEANLLEAPILESIESTPVFASYDIQNTPVSTVSVQEEEFSMPIRIIKSAKGAPTKHKPLQTRKVVKKASSAKNLDGVKVAKKSKPRAKKKAPVPPEATGFGFQKIDSEENK